jgi:WD40 repeat protein
MRTTSSTRTSNTPRLISTALCIIVALGTCRASDRFLITDADGFSSGSIRDIALSADGKWLAAAGEKQVRVWNVKTGSLLASIRGFQLAPHLKVGRTNAVAFSPDGQYLIAGISDNTDDGSTRMYRMSDLDKLDALLPGHKACSDRVAFSEDGTYFASYG